MLEMLQKNYERVHEKDSPSFFSKYNIFLLKAMNRAFKTMVSHKMRMPTMKWVICNGS